MVKLLLAPTVNVVLVVVIAGAWLTVSENVWVNVNPAVSVVCTLMWIGPTVVKTAFVVSVLPVMTNRLLLLPLPVIVKVKVWLTFGSVVDRVPTVVPVVVTVVRIVVWVRLKLVIGW